MFSINVVWTGLIGVIPPEENNILLMLWRNVSKILKLIIKFHITFQITEMFPEWNEIKNATSCFCFLLSPAILWTHFFSTHYIPMVTAHPYWWSEAFDFRLSSIGIKLTILKKYQKYSVLSIAKVFYLIYFSLWLLHRWKNVFISLTRSDKRVMTS